jgi:hypothetical protein
LEINAVPSEAARVAEEVDESHANDPVDVQNEIGFLARCDLLHLEGVVQQRSGGEMFAQELLDKSETKIEIPF